MTHQLSLLSPEMTEVKHPSMWLPSVVCGLGLASVRQKDGTPWASGGPGDGLLGGPVLWVHPTGQERWTAVPLVLLATTLPYRLEEDSCGSEDRLVCLLRQSHRIVFWGSHISVLKDNVEPGVMMQTCNLSHSGS